jgi:hypothetical protein
MMVMNTWVQRAMALSLLILWLPSCGRQAAETVPLSAGSTAPSTASDAARRTPVLSIISPLGTTELSGGQDLRIALLLVDQTNQPREGAVVHTELWAPSGELWASLSCTDTGEGHYLSEYVSLPVRGAGGTWRVTGKASWNGGQQAAVDSTFQAKPSISETYRDRYGFWIEHPRVFGFGTGFYNLAQSGGLHFEDWVNEDGSGYVILDNYRYDALGVTFTTLEVHWRGAQSPADGDEAVVFAQSLAATGLHHQEPDTPLAELTATRTTFQGRPAWQVVGEGQEYYVAEAAAGYPVECLIFQCPGSDWLWSLVLSTDHEPYMDHLRAVRETFECPPGKAG